MKLFTQLALVTAIATSGSAFAMQSMNDAALSETTGQDGITILIAPPTLGTAVAGRTNGITIGAAVLHDKDGFTGSLGGGAIILGDASQADGAATTNAAGVQMGIYGSKPITVKIDASSGKVATGTGGTAPVLNVNVALPSDFMIRTGDISVDGSNRAAIATGAAAATIANAATGGTTGNAVKILNSMDIALGGASLNIQLGNTPQGAMIKASGTITGGLSISGLGLIDNTAGFGGTLGVSMLTVKNTGAADLTIGADIGVLKDVALAFGGTADGIGGLLITTTGPAMDIMMQNVTLGSATSTLGDLQLINVQANGTKIAIMGR